ARWFRPPASLHRPAAAASGRALRARRFDSVSPYRCSSLLTARCNEPTASDPRTGAPHQDALPAVRLGAVRPATWVPDAGKGVRPFRAPTASAFRAGARSDCRSLSVRRDDLLRRADGRMRHGNRLALREQLGGEPLPFGNALDLDRGCLDDLLDARHALIERRRVWRRPALQLHEANDHPNAQNE